LPRGPVSRSRVVAGALTRSLLHSVLLIGASALLWTVDPRLAALFALVGSSVLMLRAYRRESQVTLFGCLMPAAGALVCVVVQAASLDAGRDSASYGLAFPMGIFLGLLSARGQAMFVRGRAVYAKKKGVFLFAWTAAVVCTQGFALFGQRELVGFGLAGGYFTAAMTVTASLVIAARYRREKARVAAVLLLFLAAAVWQSARPAQAQDDVSQGFRSSLEAGNAIFERAKTDRASTLKTPPSSPQLQTAQDAVIRRKEASGANLSSAYEDKKCQPPRVGNSGIREFHLPGFEGPDARNFILLLVDVEQTCDAIYAVHYLRWANDREIQEEIRRTGAQMDRLGINYRIPRHLNLADYMVFFLHDNANGEYAFQPVYSSMQGDDETFTTATERDRAIASWKSTFSLVEGLAGGNRVGEAIRSLIPRREREETASTPPQPALDEPEYATSLFAVALMLALMFGMNFYSAMALAHELLTGDPVEPVEPPPVVPPQTPPPQASGPEPLRDPETGEPLPQRDGPGGGQVFYHGRWMSPADAERQMEIWNDRLLEDRRRWYAEQTQNNQQQKAEKLKQEGQEYDPAREGWRRPPEFDPVEVPPEDPNTRGFEMRPGIFTYEVTQPGLEDRYQQLDKAQDAAIDKYKSIKAERDAARASGDDWLAERLDQRLGDARSKVSEIQRLKDDLQSGPRQFQDGIDRVSARDAAGNVAEGVSAAGDAAFDAAVGMADTGEKMLRGKPAFQDTLFAREMIRSLEATNRLQREMDAGREADYEDADALQEMKDLNRQLQQARLSGDTDLEASLRSRGEALRGHFRQKDDEAAEFLRTKRQWEMEASKANLRSYVKAAETVAAGTGAVDAADDVTAYIEKWRRGAGSKAAAEEAVEVVPQAAHDGSNLAAVKQHLADNPAEAEHYYINMDKRRLVEAMKQDKLVPGGSQAIYASPSGTGPLGYTFKETHVVRIPKEKCVEAARFHNGQFYDAGGKLIAVEPNKVVMLPAPEGTGHTIMYVDQHGRATPNLPVAKLQRWVPGKGFKPMGSDSGGVD
jgi:hypothetical protein